MDPDTSMISWLHIGDLHVSDRNAESLRDLRQIVDLANALPPGSLNFAVLAGDSADDGTNQQFALVRDAVAPLRLPLHILPGDHDFNQRSLQSFYRTLQRPRLPYAATVQGHGCLFLDVVSAGTGGLDFRLDQAQLDWVEQELRQSASAVVFMHTYPADLSQGAERLCSLLASASVRCVDMGHTHYNELANDGGTIFMATRSVGQAEEGPPGFSIAAIDGDTVSWRFKPVDQAWPFVLVTQPADRRLVTRRDQRRHRQTLVRAQILADSPIATVEVSVDFGDWHAVMRPVPDQVAMWQTCLDSPGDSIRVRAWDSLGRHDMDGIVAAGPTWTPPARLADGSDRNRVGSWPFKGILGTQLGPHRNGRKW